MNRLDRGPCLGHVFTNFLESLLIQRRCVRRHLLQSLSNVENLLASPSLVLLHETERHAALLRQVMCQSGVSGNLVHDAHIVALMLEHGVTAIMTADADFKRFAGIQVANPFGS